MEAAATPLHRPQVRTLNDRLVIESLVVDDDNAFRLVQQREEAGDDPVKLVVDALAIGARVLDREQTGAQADWMKAELTRVGAEADAQITEKTRKLAERFDQKVDEVFSPDVGVLTKALERHFGDGSSEAVQHRVRAVVDELMRTAHDDLRKTFTGQGADNPLADFKAASLGMINESSKRQAEHLRTVDAALTALKAEVQGLREDKQRLQEVAAEREKGTGKGRTFEEDVCAALDRIAAAQGDTCEATGDFGGPLGRKGDVVVDIGACDGPGCGRIVWEAKDRKLSRPDMLKELDAALEHRSADFAVLVVAGEDKVPARTESLREFNGDKLVVAWEPDDDPLTLEVAYKLARARVTLAQRDDDSIDLAALRDRVERARTAMDEVRRIKTTLTGASRHLESAQGLLDDLAKRVRGHLAEIDEALSPAGAEDSEPVEPALFG